MNTYPTSSYDDLGKVILSLGIGEAIVTVMNERGAPTPVAWTRLRAPESLMGPADAAGDGGRRGRVSPLHAKYAEAVDRESAREMLAAQARGGRRQGEGRGRGEGAVHAEDAPRVAVRVRTRAWWRRSWARPRSAR